MEKKIPLKKTKNLKMPMLGLGTWQIKNNAEYVVYDALKKGYRLIDTAKAYNNETEIGKAIKKAMKDFKIKREEIFVTTKLWNSDQGRPVKAFNESLKKLGLKYIDLYLIHWPMPKRIEAWRKMQRLLKTEKCRALGVSNFSINQIQELVDKGLPKPSVNQVEFSPFLFKKDLLDYCKERNIVLEGYSPLTRGKKLDDKRLVDLAKKYKKTPAQIILRWATQHGVVVIPKASSQEHLEENKNIFDFKIDKKDIEKLDMMDSNYYSTVNPKFASFFMSLGSRLGF